MRPFIRNGVTSATRPSHLNRYFDNQNESVDSVDRLSGQTLVKIM